MCHGQQPRIQPCHRHALFAFEVTGLGPVHADMHKLGRRSVALAIDWTRTSANHRARLSNDELESQLLLGLEDATRWGLLQKSLHAVPGDCAAYRVVWQRRSVIGDHHCASSDSTIGAK